MQPILNQHDIKAALFVGVQAQLLSSIPAENTPLINTLTFFSYAGLVLNIGASLSAMNLVGYLGEVPEQYWRKSLKTPSFIAPSEPDPSQDGFQLLASYGGYSKMRAAYNHSFRSLICGTCCLIVQITLLAWLKLESVVVFALLIIICSLSVMTTYPGQFVVAFVSGLYEGLFGGADSQNSRP